MADLAGKIAFLDRTRQSTQPDISGGAGCSVVDRARRAQAAGAIGVVIAQTVESSPLAFSPDGLAHDLSIPVMQIDKSDGDALRSALCPKVEGGRCTGGVMVRGALVDEKGGWGRLRVIDFTNASKPKVIGTYEPPHARTFPPPDAGVYSVARSTARGSVGFVAANSDGLRVVDLLEGARELGAFVPPASVDPTGVLPAKPFVVGVAIIPGTPYVVATDINSGLYVLEY